MRGLIKSIVTKKIQFVLSSVTLFCPARGRRERERGRGQVLGLFSVNEISSSSSSYSIRRWKDGQCEEEDKFLVSYLLLLQEDFTVPFGKPETFRAFAGVLSDQNLSKARCQWLLLTIPLTKNI